MLKRLSIITAASAVAMTLVVGGEAQAAVFTQTKTAVEQDLDDNNLADPFVFEFSSLAPVAPGETGFNLDLSFTDLDVGESFEFLTMSIESSGNTYNFGEFLTTNISSPADVNGSGTIFVNFSEIGGSFFSDPFQVTLTPNSNVHIITPGSADLTLSYNTGAVPEPLSVLGWLTAGGFGVVGRRMKRKQKQEEK